MKKITFFSLLAMFLFVRSNVWADTYSHTFESTELTNGAVGTISLTLSDVEWTIAMDGGKVSVFDNDKGAHFGTNNETCKSVTLSTVGIPGTITSVMVEASRGTNLQGTLEVTVGGAEFATSGETGLTTTNTSYEFLGSTAGEVAIVWKMTGGKGAFYVKSITIEYSDDGGGGVIVARPVIIPNGGTFYDPQEVTITSEGNTIYYTLDGTDPTDASTQYTAPFTIGENCTVKAIAYDDDDNASSIASAEFVFKTIPTYATIAEICAAATDTEETVTVEFNGWICTGVKNSNAYFTDGTKGILVYQSGHGFEVGDVLKGSAHVKLKLYNECAEIMSLTSTTEGLIVEKGDGATPQAIAIADLEKDMQGCLIYLEGVTYTAGKFVDDDDNTITPYGTFIQLPTLIEGQTYNVTGVAIWYKNNQIWEIAPRTADEIVLITSQIAPESSWSVESEVVDITGVATAVFTTNSDGVVTYESSNEEVATIDENGMITLVGKGVTKITAFVAESDVYLPDSRSFILTVTVDGYADVVFAYNDADIEGQGAPDVGSELSASRNDGVITLYANKAYAKTGDTHIKIYGSKYEGKDEERVLTEPSYIRLFVAQGYAITEIVLTATGEDYIKEWQDQFGTAAEINDVTATWNGLQEEVILTNMATSQARIKSIAVTYANPNAVGISLTPAIFESEGAIYNLAGQRLSKMQKGINIVGGKKVLR